VAVVTINDRDETMLKRFTPLLIVGFVFAANAQQPAAHFDGNAWWGHVKILADDNMEGRETGSAGLRRAQAYVEAQLQHAQVQAAGIAGFEQPVKFESRQIVEKDSSITLVRDGKAQPLVLGDDAFFSTRIDLAPEVNAPLVFVGYGLSIPEKNYDDLAGLDLKGKVVVLVSGAPAEIPGPLASHSQSASERWKALSKAGAVGVISIPNPGFMDIPWSRMSVNRTHPSMALVGREFDETPGEKFAATFNPAKAEQLFAGSGHTADEIFAPVHDRKPLPRFPLQVSIRARAKVEKTQVESSNLVAQIPGSDPTLKNEYVVISAHLDHIGIGEPINGDRIYNGAMDNASGSAALLEIALSLKRQPEKLKRSVLFLWLTAEEKGLLGSKYFAMHPTVNPKSIVADINMDMFLPIVPMHLLTVYGLVESDLGDMVQKVSAAQGIAVQPDPEPLRNSFIRSDQYSFILHGVPSLAMKVGFDAEHHDVYVKWLHDRYHAPSDDLQQPVDLDAAAKFEEIVRGLAVAVANSDKRPAWKSDSFFRRYGG
jgi:Zn-dependent M28 family amino/carboxypeptidase